MENLGIYIHFPYCMHKCPYCDFYSLDHWTEEDKQRMVGALCREIDLVAPHYKKGRKLTSIYFGGGTPTLLSVEQFGLILESLKKYFKITQRTEITVECNPKTVNEEKLRGFKEWGVNRLSIGAQSLDDSELEILGRIHKAEDVYRCMNMARKVGIRNISLDFMFGIPGQKFTTWMETLNKAIALNPKHISFYSLEFSEGTLYTQMLESGRLQATAPEDDRLMYQWAVRILEEAGYHQYEISSAAKGRYACTHNLGYWDLTEYLGIGPSAHSYMENVRYCNLSDAREYVRVMEEENGLAAMPLGTTNAVGTMATVEYEKNDFWDNVSEYVFIGLRKTAGIDKERFHQKFGKELWDIYEEVHEDFMGFVGAGYAVDDEKCIRLTLDGMNIANQVISLFL